MEEIGEAKKEMYENTPNAVRRRRVKTGNDEKSKKKKVAEMTLPQRFTRTSNVVYYAEENEGCGLTRSYERKKEVTSSLIKAEELQLIPTSISPSSRSLRPRKT